MDKGLNVCILGPSDSGKSYLAKALGVRECYRGSVLYSHCEKLLEEMAALKKKDYAKFKKKIVLPCKAGPSDPRRFSHSFNNGREGG